MVSQIEVIDQLGERVYIADRLERIVSLVPSQTELLHYLGLEEKVVGITKFCIHPAKWKKTKTVIGGTKNFKFDVIDALSPDLIIGNKEENYLEGIEQLKANHKVLMSDIETIEDAFNMIRMVGIATQTQKRADKLVEELQNCFKRITKIKRQLSVLYFIWRKPWMVAGTNTFINEMLSLCGFKNVAPASRYPEIDLNTMKQLKPDVILLSSEPYPFKEEHMQELKELLPSTQFKLVDGEMFSWYGSHLLQAPAYFNQLLERF
jgi:ABC-type Fe3+-hydroxamate transport system substrate-binding protein